MLLEWPYSEHKYYYYNNNVTSSKHATSGDTNLSYNTSTYHIGAGLERTLAALTSLKAEADRPPPTSDTLSPGNQ